MQGLDDQAALATRLLHRAPAVPPLGRVNTGRVNTGAPASLADKLEPDTPSQAATRAVSGNPVEDPVRAASGSPARGVSRAPPSSPGSPSVDEREIQDGQWCNPKRCSCCWATGKAKGTGDPSTHCMLHICCNYECSDRLQQALAHSTDLMCSIHALESVRLF